MENTTYKPFVTAYYVLKILREEAGVHNPYVMCFEDGNTQLCISREDFTKAKQLAQNLMLSTNWFVNPYGDYCLASKTAMVIEETTEPDLERKDH